MKGDFAMAVSRLTTLKEFKWKFQFLLSCDDLVQLRDNGLDARGEDLEVFVVIRLDKTTQIGSFVLPVGIHRWLIVSAGDSRIDLRFELVMGELLEELQKE